MIELEDITEMPVNNNSSNKMAKKERNLFRADISRLIKLGVTTETHADDSGFVSSIFLSKKNKSHRQILYLKKFNRHVTYRHFKMDNLSTALTMVMKNCYTASVDLAEGYYLVSVSVVSKKYQLLLRIDSLNSYIYPMALLQYQKFPQNSSDLCSLV